MDRYLRAYSLPRSDFFSYIDRQNLDPQLTKRVKTKVVQHALLRFDPAPVLERWAASRQAQAEASMARATARRENEAAAAAATPGRV
jgi:hypothetical protein